MAHSFRCGISNSKNLPDKRAKADTFSASRHWAVKQGHSGIKNEDFNAKPEAQTA